MDVKLGHCWRCEMPIVGTLEYCKLCWIAVYCSEACKFADIFRHSVPECEEWGPKRCSNSRCEEVGTAGKFMECSGCVNVFYCGRKCQAEDWANHSASCERHKQTMISCFANLSMHFTRHRQPMTQPYYIGNALAIDMLNLKNNELKNVEERNPTALKKHFAILSVGCGNLRNFIHTLVCLPKTFAGKVDTTLNDQDPFVQARNLLFLFMMISLPDKLDIAGIITTLWYSVYLSEEHYQFLKSCLRILTTIELPHLIRAMDGLVDISKKDFELIKKVWKKWLHLECSRNHPGYINLKRQRDEMFEVEEDNAQAVQDFKKELDDTYIDSFQEWLENAIFLPTSKDRKQYLEYANPTLTGFKVYLTKQMDYKLKNDEKAVHYLHPESSVRYVYCIPPDLHPFGEWDHTLVRRFSDSNHLIDMYFVYVEDQIANCINSLKSKQYLVSFNVDNCLDIEYTLRGRKFDRIFTSNVADIVGTEFLLATYKPFLNHENRFATIVTQYWGWYQYFATLRGRIRKVESIWSHYIPELRDYFRKEETIREKDGIHEKAALRCVLDTGKTKHVSSSCCQEYFNNTDYFISYLRAEQTACTPLLLPTYDTILTFQEVKECQGLRMRDFRRELNKVVPFQYRRNVRHVSMMRGHRSHMIEWCMP